MIAAEHEAAHAVAYRALGYPIYSVEIFGEEGLTLSTPGPTDMSIYDHATVSMAGVIIENRHGTHGTHGDLEDVPVELREFGLSAASAILDANKEKHEKITQALAYYEYLNAHDFETVWNAS